MPSRQYPSSLSSSRTKTYLSIDEYVKDVVIGKGYGEPGYLAVINDDKSITFWHYSYYFDVDYDNPVYYSKDGELYTKSDDKCVYPEIS